MITGIAFLFTSAAIGVVGYWMVVNEKIDPDGGYLGWLAMTKPKPESQRQQDEPGR